jgi:hypothetical protein
MLSEAKLSVRFPILRSTLRSEILRFAQNDKVEFFQGSRSHRL